MYPDSCAASAARTRHDDDMARDRFLLHAAHVVHIGFQTKCGELRRQVFAPLFAMDAPAVSELVFLSYCDVSYAGVRASVEAIQWHKAAGHTVQSHPLSIIVQCGNPSVPLPEMPSASATLTTVTMCGRVVASYAIIHCALLRSHAAANAAAVLSVLAQRGARRIFLLSAVHQPIFKGLRCQVSPL